MDLYGFYLFLVNYFRTPLDLRPVAFARTLPIDSFIPGFKPSFCKSFQLLPFFFFFRTD